MKTKKQATERAKLLLSKMKTKGWKTEVWENLGWHYTIYCGNLRVHEYDNKYYTMLSDGICVGTPGYWSHTRQYDDPNKAVVMVLGAAKKFVKECNKIIEEAEKDLGL